MALKNNSFYIIISFFINATVTGIIKDIPFDT